MMFAITVSGSLVCQVGTLRLWLLPFWYKSRDVGTLFCSQALSSQTNAQRRQQVAPIQALVPKNDNGSLSISTGSSHNGVKVSDKQQACLHTWVPTYIQAAKVDMRPVGVSITFVRTLPLLPKETTMVQRWRCRYCIVGNSHQLAKGLAFKLIP